MAMADGDEKKRDTATGAWGTLEELLLACAVSRYGTENWDFVAMEVQKRSSTSQKSSRSSFSKAFTPRICEQRYHALKRRFDVTGEGAVAGESDLREDFPFMIDELRKLRVEELRREVERRDFSIVSLELKVKRLQEERGRSSLKKAEDEADLATRPYRSGAGEEPGGSSAEVADKPEDRSIKESNSTSRIQKPDENDNAEPDPVQPVVEAEPAKDFSSGGDGCGFEELVGRASRPVRLGNTGELTASVSEPKREIKESESVKQSSDVQSSGRGQRRRWRRSNGFVGCSSDEIEAEESSPANKRTGEKSQPLIKFLEIVRSHRHGSVFQRRLPSQETQKYKNLIKQHMDLETVQSKLERGIYCDYHPRLLRDLLLLFTNAIIFFCKSSTEHLAARELRRLVTKEIAAQKPKPSLPVKPKPSLPVKPDSEARIPDLIAKKPLASTNIVVCRRRRDSSAKRQDRTDGKEEEVENGGLRTKPDNAKDKQMMLKRERSNLSTSNNNNKASNDNKKSSNNGNGNGSNVNKKDEISDEEEQPINKRRKKMVSSKKEGVVNFLKRIKQSSPSKEAEKAKAGDDTEEKQEERVEIMDLSKKKVVIRKEIDNDGGGKDDGAAKMRVLGRGSAREGGLVEVGRRPPTRKSAAMGGGGGGGSPDSGRVKRRREGEVVGATTEKKQLRR